MHLKRLSCLLLSLSCLVAPVAARNLDIPNAPLTATRSIQPLIMYQIDDSGSMMWDIMPDIYMPLGQRQWLPVCAWSTAIRCMAAETMRR